MNKINATFFPAPEHGGRTKPKLLPDLQQTLHEWGNAYGTHEICP